MKRVLTVMLLTSIAFTALAIDIPDEFRIKREQVFEFAQKPVITRKGDDVTITFETKGFCDVTVVIENSEGTIIRHLASGVLGKNAPDPFQKNSKKQTVVWDGKNDRGRYIDDTKDIVIRVSLGLKPRFERTLFWSPKKRIAPGNRPSFCAAPEGIYVIEGGGVDHIRRGCTGFSKGRDRMVRGNCRRYQV